MMSVVNETNALLGGQEEQEQRTNNTTTTTKRRWICIIILVSTTVVVAILLVYVKKSLQSKVVHKSIGGAAAYAETKNLPTSRYKGTQFISFTVNTMGGLADRGECNGLQIDDHGVCYLGNPANLTEDVHHRLGIVKRVLDRFENDASSSKKNPMVNHDHDILKIVLLPEFFWRGPHGAYSTAELLDDGGILQEVFHQLQELVKGTVFDDFFFVFGTVLAAHQSTNDPRNKPWEHKLSGHDEVLYYNFAPAIKGGPSTTHGDNKYCVTNKYISNVDFLNRTSLLPINPRNFAIEKYSKAFDEIRTMFESRNVKFVEDNVLELDGLRIGLEISLDHRLGVLWDSLEHNDEPLVDILLIASAGMAMEHGPNPILPGGVVYLTDGKASSAACRRSEQGGEFDPSQVCRQGPSSLKQFPPQETKASSSYFTLQSCVDVFDPNLYNGYYSRYQTQGCANTLKLYGINVLDEFKEYPPSIEVYPTVLLPPRTYID